MYPKEFFIEQFSELTNEQLLVKISAQELADTARSAIYDILATRGVPNASIELMSKELHKAEIRKTKGTIECDYCGNSAKRNPLFDNGQRFCSSKCLTAIRISEAAVDLSPSEISEKAQSIMNGVCPECSGHESIVEVRYYHRVMSIVYFTRYTKKSSLCCVACGRKKNIKSFWLTMLLGWWGFPFGLLFTPAYLIANMGEMFEKRSQGEPSEELLREAKYQLALVSKS
jgi:hypothetical protein